jgi:glycosyltransferase involved in cell wall biosynthesis
MAMAKPVVASRVGGIPDIVDDGVNGFLVTPGNVEELADAIEKLLGNNKMAVRMGNAGRERLRREFSAEFMVQAIENVYRSLLRDKGFGIDR